MGVGSKARKMKKAYIGIGGKARKVKKMYIGVGGKARLCYSAELERYGMAAALSTARYDMRAATVGKYALFAGGLAPNPFFGEDTSSSVDAYNTSLTKSTPTELSCKRCGHAAASVGGYALFAGGASSHNFLGYGNIVSSVDAYDASLTRSAAHIIGATVAIGGAAVGNYALFAGGTVDGIMTKDTVTSDVLAYDSSLTFTTAPLLSVARAGVKGASVGNYALFAGGRAGSFCTTVDAYNASLTRTTATALSSEENRTAAATVGEPRNICGQHCLRRHLRCLPHQNVCRHPEHGADVSGCDDGRRLRHLFRRWSGRFLRRISDPEQHRHQHDGLLHGCCDHRGLRFVCRRAIR